MKNNVSIEYDASVLNIQTSFIKMFYDLVLFLIRMMKKFILAKGIIKACKFN